MIPWKLIGQNSKYNLTKKPKLFYSQKGIILLIKDPTTLDFQIIPCPFVLYLFHVSIDEI